MTDDLVQRLRRTYRKEYAATGSMFGDNLNKPFPFPILATEVLFNPDGCEAADRIQTQAAEIEQWKVDYNELLLEAAKLRAALKNHSYTGKGWRPFKEIYEALREKNDD